MTEIEQGVAVVDDLKVHYLMAGEGPLVVLLHGWPQTSHCWRHVLPELARDHTVLAPDLRGYGRTDKPTSGYDKRTTAADMSGLIESLGHSTAYVVGHDRGGRVAHRWALDKPEQVTRLAVLDIVPSRAMWQNDVTKARGYWHWLFHLQPDLPELLAGRDVGAYLGYFFDQWTVNRHGLADGIDEYVRAFSAPGALRAGFDDYRASFPFDTEADDASFDAGQRLDMPVLALWGDSGLPSGFDVLATWQQYATDVRGHAIERCGHFLAEERPAELLAELRAFLGRG